MDATRGAYEVEYVGFGLAVRGQVSGTQGTDARAVPWWRGISWSPRRFDCIYLEVEKAIAFGAG
jgi:hypothetical protein